MAVKEKKKNEDATTTKTCQVKAGKAGQTGGAIPTTRLDLGNFTPTH